MLTKKNVGRPAQPDLKNIIKCKVDDLTSNTIKELSKSYSKSQSDILREIIPIVSSKDFEGLIPKIALEQLQKISEECWNQLHIPNSLFEVAKVSDNMPAFITSWEPPMIHVKYPTYKINICSKENLSSIDNQNKIDEILRSVSLEKRSKVFSSPINYIVPYNGFPIIETSFIFEVMCLNNTLEDNIKTKDQIISLLEESEYAYSVCSAYCIHSERIVFLEENKYFKIFKTV